MTRLLTYVVGISYKLLHENNNIITDAILYYIQTQIICNNNIQSVLSHNSLKSLMNSIITVMSLLHITNLS